MLQIYGMLKLNKIEKLYINVRRVDIKEFEMNGISTKQSSNLSQTASKQTKESAETAGSLAMAPTPLFAVPVYNYDMFVPTNPFSLNIDFSSYSQEGQENLANNSGFMQGFANAMSVINGFSGGDSFSGVSSMAIASAGCGGGSCSMGGGFTSLG